MTVTNREEGLARLRHRGSALVPCLEGTEGGNANLVVHVPRDLVQMRSAHDFLLSRPEWENGGWFWVTDYVFDVEIYSLLAQMRAVLGEERELFDAPAHFFGAGEFRLVEPLVVATSYFEMDFFLVSEDEKLIVFQTHDEFWDIRCEDPAVLEEFQTFFAEFEGKVLG